MNSIPVYVYHEEEEGWIAHVPALLGVNAMRPTRDEALRAAREMLEEETTFLRSRGVSVPAFDPDGLIPAEPVADNLLPEDMRPLTHEDIELLLRRMSLSRERLLGLLDSLPAEDLARTPEGGWSVNRILEHMANAEWFYTTRVFVWPGDPREAAQLGRSMLVERLLGLSEAERANVIRYYATEWSVRKVIRRALETERGWADYVNAVLAGHEGHPLPNDPWHGNETLPGELEPMSRDELVSRVDELRKLGEEMDRRAQNISKEYLDRTPGADRPSAGEALFRLGGAHGVFRLRLTEWPADPMARLIAVRAMAVERLSALTDAERVAAAPDLTGEIWSTHKVFRRTLEHDREHYDHIRQVLAQIR